MGAASFGTGTKIDLKLLSLGGIAGTYKIVQAGSLTGAGNLTASSATLPFLYASNLITSTPGQVSLEVRLKAADELGLNASEASILDAVIGAADTDAPVAGVFLGTQDSRRSRTRSSRCFRSMPAGRSRTSPRARA